MEIRSPPNDAAFSRPRSRGELRREAAARRSTSKSTRIYRRRPSAAKPADEFARPPWTNGTGVAEHRMFHRHCCHWAGLVACARRHAERVLAAMHRSTFRAPVVTCVELSWVVEKYGRTDPRLGYGVHVGQQYSERTCGERQLPHDPAIHRRRRYIGGTRLRGVGGRRHAAYIVSPMNAERQEAFRCDGRATSITTGA